MNKLQQALELIKESFDEIDQIRKLVNNPVKNLETTDDCLLSIERMNTGYRKLNDYDGVLTAIGEMLTKYKYSCELQSYLNRRGQEDKINNVKIRMAEIFMGNEPPLPENPSTTEHVESCYGSREILEAGRGFSK